ncbi:5-formyltetrahydrofolate cyclo-ligase [Chloropicon primus]|uniref:5-formyltetrahydrofolate cyclo-ligase n=1 Tax=Chloropicon primus TaxID=1764295 RepID=A0A5B8MEG1_9CHLO|nr:5-formyltetrahydrofolate cyclo-ligase [Chloropicon primus]UPQ96948.1 5-formyltetrahydrofolate cyclo-ligase [Chloropicon primus]|eukprot:QDZ17730.1 5-formyltetrahydrofolate cyclo-ligase [Chloropicon primus]
MASKLLVRKEMKARLAKLSVDQARTESAKVLTTLLAWQPFKRAAKVGLYCSSEKMIEVQTPQLIEACLSAEKACFLPKVDGDGEMRLLRVSSVSELSPAPPFGIPEPVPRPQGMALRPEALDEGLDLLVVPGLAFDEEGRRLGRGGGYYDRYIEKLLSQESRPLLAGVCFSCQVLPEVPCEEHDARMDAVVVPGKVLLYES